jgi:Icc-related predicted phosphoesterase
MRLEKIKGFWYASEAPKDCDPNAPLVAMGLTKKEAIAGLTNRLKMWRKEAPKCIKLELTQRELDTLIIVLDQEKNLNENTIKFFKEHGKEDDEELREPIRNMKLHLIEVASLLIKARTSL